MNSDPYLPDNVIRNQAELIEKLQAELALCREALTENEFYSETDETGVTVVTCKSCGAVEAFSYPTHEDDCIVAQALGRKIK